MFHSCDGTDGLARRQPERATALLGAASARREAIGVPRGATDRPSYEETLTVVRAAAKDRFTADWARGRALSLDAAIAVALVISINTVYRHVAHIVEKTGAANRVEAAAYAHRHGLSDPR